MNQEVGFAKEYEEIRAASCLHQFAAQECDKADNQERNRYPNIVACKYRYLGGRGFTKYSYSWAHQSKA